MYAPLSDALNLGLECLSKIEVDGLPEFQNHIVFVPLDERVTSDRDLEGSCFKPDLALMSFTTACDFRKIKDTRSLTVSQFIDKISKKTRSKMGPPKTLPSKNVPKNAPAKNNSTNIPPSYHIGWKEVLSAVEVKRGSNTNWPTLCTFTDVVPTIVVSGSNEQNIQSRTPNPETSSDVSQSQTREIHVIVDERTADELYSCNFKTQREQAVRDRCGDQLWSTKHGL